LILSFFLLVSFRLPLVPSSFFISFIIQNKQGF
jgi:hypothetical protein